MTKEEQKDYGVKVTQASRTGLIVLMYEITIRYLDEATEAMGEKDIPAYRQALKKARSFINELNSVLDLSYGIGRELQNLYLFMNRTLQQADIRKDSTDISRIRDMLEMLKTAFSEVEKSDLAGPVMENTQQIYAGLTYSRGSLNENVNSDPNRGFIV